MKSMLLRLCAISLLVLLNIIPTLAQEEVLAGKVVSKQDWIDFMPVFIGVIILVLIVDAFFIMPIFRKNSNEEQ